jgi:hypothetical protein
MTLSLFNMCVFSCMLFLINKFKNIQKYVCESLSTYAVP